MVEFEKFVFAAPPCTGSRWFVNRCNALGVPVLNWRYPKVQANKECEKFVLSIIRHPYYWLLAFFEECKCKLTGVREIDIFNDDYRGCRGDFQEFCKVYLQRHPGRISEMFSSYRAASVMRHEDMPWCAEEFLMSLGVPYSNGQLPKTDFQSRVLTGWSTNKELRKAVIRAERDFCEAYGYY